MESIPEDQDLNNIHGRTFNSAIESALEQRYGHTRNIWRRIAHLLLAATEMVILGGRSSIYQNVIQILRENRP